MILTRYNLRLYAKAAKSVTTSQQPDGDVSRAVRIETTLDSGIALDHLEVIDESANHNVPQGAESHFKVVAVSDSFDGMSRINRHRRINDLLAAEFAAGMHALAVHAYAPEEWRARFGDAPMSPPCAHQKSE